MSISWIDIDNFKLSDSFDITPDTAYPSYELFIFRSNVFLVNTAERLPFFDALFDNLNIFDVLLWLSHYSFTSSVEFINSSKLVKVSTTSPFYVFFFFTDDFVVAIFYVFFLICWEFCISYTPSKSSASFFLSTCSHWSSDCWGLSYFDMQPPIICF